MSKSCPIAVLDTGAGGLSVVNSLRSLLPHEDICYFADTAHLPYGIKSPELISRLSLRMAQKIVEISHCKILVIACHTISVWCLAEIQKSIGIPVVGMVEPSIQGLKQLIAEKDIASVAILSTNATKTSGAYRKAWDIVDNKHQVALIEHASTPLVYLVEEEGLLLSEMAGIVEQFIPESVRNADALLIGCTHFSALKPTFAQILKPDSLIIDGADLAAAATKETLQSFDGLAAKDTLGQLKVYVSDNKERFLNVSQRFITGELAVTLINDYAGT